MSKLSEIPHSLEQTPSKEGAACDKDRGCSRGICPGMLLAVLFLVGWGLFTAAGWVWTFFRG